MVAQARSSLIPASTREAAAGARLAWRTEWVLGQQGHTSSDLKTWKLDLVVQARGPQVCLYPELCKRDCPKETKPLELGLYSSDRVLT